MSKIELIQGDCLITMKDIPDKSIDMVLTSPPYDNLRTYNGSLDWGEHVWKPVIQELFRIVKDGGVVVWVVGDETSKFCESLVSFKQAIYFNDNGFNLLDTMIYYKQNYAPAYPTLRRYANQFEYMFVFSKGKPKTFNAVMVDKVGNRNGWSGFRQKDGSVKRKIVKTHGDKKQASNVWSFPVGFKNCGHPAVFPEKLAHDHIISWSNEGDIILDPFAGSGTVGKMAKQLNRNCILIEKVSEYFKIAEKRINENL